MAKKTKPSEPQWKTIPGFPCYEVSDRGDVRRVPGPVLLPGKTLKAKVTKYGRSFALRMGGKTYWRTMHSLMAQAFIGPCPRGKVAGFINGNKADVRPDNIHYTTHKDTIRVGVKFHADKTKKGKAKK